MSEKHEGWTNRETWYVALTIDNDRRELEYVLAYVRRNPPSVPGRPESLVLDEIAEGLRGHVERGVPSSTRRDLHKDCGPGSISRVNWRELAEHYITKAREGVTS